MVKTRKRHVRAGRGVTSQTPGSNTGKERVGASNAEVDIGYLLRLSNDHGTSTLLAEQCLPEHMRLTSVQDVHAWNACQCIQAGLHLGDHAPANDAVLHEPARLRFGHF